MASQDVSSFLENFLGDPHFNGSNVTIKRLTATEAQYRDFPEDLNPAIRASLEKRGIEHLYTHQRESWDLARQKKDFVVITPTASGKTLCYNLPVVQTLLEEPDARALYLFPTKALSQDQQAELNELIEAGRMEIGAATFDGDTPQAVRRAARESGRIIISNPDMLHSGILPNHARWIKFFSSLRYIVVDEMHIYRGVFGSHVANVLRRLLRIAQFYGSRPSFVFCSATIANPLELARLLSGRDAELVDNNGAARAEKTIVIYNPPLVDRVQGIRKSSALESRTIAVKLLEKNIRTILFARSRLRVEIIASYIRSHFANIYNDNRGIRVEPYRSGLLPGERRAIEKGLRDGSIQAVVSTNALELGIDIGGLDAAVIAGWPGSLSSFWQQSGRAGRRAGFSLVFFVASSSALDQYYAQTPESFLNAGNEAARIDPENPYIFIDHLKCAVFELPFSEGESFGPPANRELSAEGLELLCEGGVLRHTGGRYHWASDAYPAEKISLRSASSDNVVIIDTTRGKSNVIGEMDRPGAKELLFPDAVYIHRGRQYLVLELDIENRICRVEERELDYYTDSVNKFDIKVLSEDYVKDGNNYRMITGDLLVRVHAAKFKKLRFQSHENIGYGEIYLPPEEMQSRMNCMVFDEGSNAEALLAEHDEAARGEILSGLLHLIRSLAPVHLMCDRRDLGGSWRVRDEHFDRAAIYLWDSYPGGIGLSEALTELMPTIIGDARKRLGSCECMDGCPSCAGLPDQDILGGGRRKAAIRALLMAMQG